MKNKTVAVVGAGISGLYCAKILSRYLDVTVFEKNEKIGGRIQTDLIDGFLLDHGFQVFQPAYSEGKRAFDYKSLNLHYFEAGAQIRVGKMFYEVSDPLRNPTKVFATLKAPIGSIADKLRILKLKFIDPDDEALREISTIEFLNQLGFGSEIIEKFFRPFFSGIFLERELQSPARFFAYLYKLFAISEVAVPKDGMMQLPNQLAVDAVYDLRLGEVVDPYSLNSDFDYVVQAHNTWQSGFRQVTTDYFVSDTLDFNSPLLYLNGNSDGCINHLAPMSRVSKSYGVDGNSLLSVNLLVPHIDVPVTKVTEQLCDWFPGHQFNHLKRYQIPKALPVVTKQEVKACLRDGIYYCGDGVLQPSIQGALLSGRKAAEDIIRSL
tara:strand:- start:3047 stop:4183 length:1137 start_codon:yes stop_codon:yes gene_type:complete